MSGENTNGRSLLNQNGDGYGGSLTYAIGEGFSVGGAITTSKRTADQNNTADARLYGNGDRATVYTGGLKYDANNIYLAAQYSQTYNATRFGTSNGNNKSDSYGFANKRRTLKWLLSTSSTLVCVRLWLTCSLKVRTSATATAPAMATRTS